MSTGFFYQKNGYPEPNPNTQHTRRDGKQRYSFRPGGNRQGEKNFSVGPAMG